MKIEKLIQISFSFNACGVKYPSGFIYSCLGAVENYHLDPFERPARNIKLCLT